MEIEARKLVAWHDVDDQVKVKKIAASMERSGWLGSPLVVSRMYDGRYKAWTGTHRIAAARATGIDVPVVVIDDDLMVAAGYEPDGCGEYRLRGCRINTEDEMLAAVLDSGQEQDIIAIYTAEVTAA